MEPRFIRVVGAREHNLQNISLDIPRDQLVVITGLSGSGKSSLAFDTIYAEGQRKYVESLSVHARFFLEQVGKPDVDRVEGLPPTLAIQQFVTAASPRSTVATTTEIHDFLRLLYARCGTPHCPSCGRRIQRHTVDEIVASVLGSAGDGAPARNGDARVMVLAPLARGAGAGDARVALRRVQREGFVRVRVDGQVRELREVIEGAEASAREVDVVIDRLIVRPDVRSRVADAVELALKHGEGRVIISRQAGEAWRDEQFSEHHSCPKCGLGLSELSPRAFSFNSPFGACEACGGLGATLEFAPELIVPDDRRSLLAGAIAPWLGGKKRISAEYAALLRALCAACGVKPETPFHALPADVRQIVLHGATPNDQVRLGLTFEGVIPNLERRRRAAGAKSSEKNPAMVKSRRWDAYLAQRMCGKCDGARLRPEALAVRVGELSIAEVARLSIESAAELFDRLSFTAEAASIAAPILREVRQRLRFLNDVGLGYLTLDRASASLSGGEAQRIRLGTQLGSGLVGVCYVLDEPTIGLHQRDNERLLRAIRGLVDIGNTAIVVEHDEDMIRAADWLIDIGPGAGRHGGRVLAAGPAAEALANPQSLTGKYIRGEYVIPLPDERRVPRAHDFLSLRGVRVHNLDNIDARFPLRVLCAVTGVSGAGKSTLVSEALLPALRRRLVGAAEIDRVVEIDQTPIGRTPRSNPATFTGAFDEIRRLYAKTKEARLRGYSASRFSFNAEGGRCEACQGQGTKRIEMHFLPDVFVACAACRGARYNRETLEVRYRGKSIADVLAMRVEDALRFFDSFQRIRQGLQTLADVGLSYIELGQPSNTLSGGEAQRVKLAAELSRPGGVGPLAPIANGQRSSPHTLYVLDEPTTGLHFADIEMLLAVLNRLVDMGSTVLVIEHNLDIIKAADWVIDLGPEGGARGGRIVASGPPEAIAACRESHTGRYLAPKLRVAGSQNE